MIAVADVQDLNQGMSMPERFDKETRFVPNPMAHDSEMDFDEIDMAALQNSRHDINFRNFNPDDPNNPNNPNGPDSMGVAVIGAQRVFNVAYPERVVGKEVPTEVGFEPGPQIIMDTVVDSHEMMHGSEGAETYQGWQVPFPPEAPSPVPDPGRPRPFPGPDLPKPFPGPDLPDPLPGPDLPDPFPKPDSPKPRPGQGYIDVQEPRRDFLEYAEEYVPSVVASGSIGGGPSGGGDGSIYLVEGFNKNDKKGTVCVRVGDDIWELENMASKVVFEDEDGHCLFHVGGNETLVYSVKDMFGPGQNGPSNYISGDELVDVVGPYLGDFEGYRSVAYTPYPSDVIEATALKTEYTNPQDAVPAWIRDSINRSSDMPPMPIFNDSDEKYVMPDEIREALRDVDITVNDMKNKGDIYNDIDKDYREL